MWSPDRARPRRLAAALALAAALLAGACNVRPLYGPTAIGKDSLNVTLADVDVQPAAGRVGQRIRNDLLFLLNGGNPGTGAYEVTLDVRERYANVLTRSISGLPGGRNVRLVVTFALRKTGDSEVLTSGTITRIASFDYFNQRFANDRATIDAEDRAAHEVANDIHLRLASYFVTGKSFQAPVGKPLEEEFPTSDNAIFGDQEPIYGSPE